MQDLEIYHAAMYKPTIRAGVQMPKKSFVVMGFGTKTDYTKPKTFNLDKTYRNIIKPAALAAG
jgi:hypothetical protein